MLLFDRTAPQYRRADRLWAITCGTLLIASVVWYVAYGRWWGAWRPPGGGSYPGFTFGVVGGLIIGFEMLLWPRKKYRGHRLGRTRTWMRAHIWLGLFCLPILLLHGSFQLNVWSAPLAAWLSWLLIAVVVSGAYGLYLQHVLPRRILENVPAETIHAQIPHVLSQYLQEARRMVRVTCGQEQIEESVEEPSYLVVSTFRRSGQVQGRSVETGVEPAWVPESEPLAAFFQSQIVTFLTPRQDVARHPLNAPRTSEGLFADLKSRLRPEAHPVVERLAELCDHRRQFAIQDRFYRRLHRWLNFHVALSVAMFTLMLVHIVVALKYL